MNITYGIITCDDTCQFIPKIIESILGQNGLNYEIIIIGGNRDWTEIDSRINHIKFDENIKKSWITKKKNLITENATNEIIVYLHDYVYFDKNWLKELENFGENWDLLCNPVLNENGGPFRSLAYLDKPNLGRKWTIREKWCPLEGFHCEGSHHHIAHPENGFDHRYVYINGTYFIAKKHIMEKYPLNEELSWGMGEDAEHSIRIRDKVKIVYNPHSIVKLCKHKELGIPICV